MTDRELMQQALKALELEDMACRYEKYPTPEHIAQAIIALRERLAQQEQGPVATVVARQYEDGTYAGNALDWAGRNCEDDLPVGTNLYTTPPQRKPRQWQGLAHLEFQKAVEGLIQRKPLTEPEAEIYKREWIGLTQEEKNDLSMEMVKAGKSVNWLTSRIEAKLREKNA